MPIQNTAHNSPAEEGFETEPHQRGKAEYRKERREKLSRMCIPELSQRRCGKPCVNRGDIRALPLDRLQLPAEPAKDEKERGHRHSQPYCFPEDIDKNQTKPTMRQRETLTQHLFKNHVSNAGASMMCSAVRMALAAAIRKLSATSHSEYAPG